MTKVLRIDSSIKGPASVTRKLTELLVARIPGAEVTARDVAVDVPLIDGAWVGAAYTPAEARSPEQAELLALSDALIAEMRAAEVIVIGMPVYNFGVTGPLKAWIDMICRVGETFRYTEAGPEGLLKGKKVYVAYASGGVPHKSAFDLASSYLTQVLAFVGITDVTFVAAEGTAIDEAAAIEKARGQIAALAA